MIQDYKKVVESDYLDYYEKYHKSIYFGLKRIQFDLLYLQKTYDFYIAGYSIKGHNIMRNLRFAIFENLVTRSFSHLYDNGLQSMSLKKFSKTICQHINPEYQQSVADILRDSTWRKNKKAINAFGGKLVHVRHRLIAHSLDKEILDYSLHLAEFKHIFRCALDHFSRLSFKPLSFYNATMEGTGADLDIEQKILTEQMDLFVRYSIVGSEWISHVDCTFEKIDDDDDDEELKKMMQKEIDYINHSKTI